MDALRTLLETQLLFTLFLTIGLGYLVGEINIKGGPRISTSGARVSAWTIPTNEELMIARHTRSLLRRN